MIDQRIVATGAGDSTVGTGKPCIALGRSGRHIRPKTLRQSTAPAPTRKFDSARNRQKLACARPKAMVKTAMFLANTLYAALHGFA